MYKYFRFALLDLDFKNWGIFIGFSIEIDGRPVAIDDISILDLRKECDIDET